MPPAKLKSASLEVQRSAEHIAEINELIQKNPPFHYVLETHTKTGKRTTLPEDNEAVIGRIQVICGQAVHCLRTALDHTYWGIVSPFATSPGQEKNIQFPFARTKQSLAEAAKNGLAHKVSPAFYQAILNLRPYREPGGNEMLLLINEIDNTRKHRTHTPICDYTNITYDIIRRQVPDFPRIGGNMFFAGNGGGDVTWFNKNFNPLDLGAIRPPFTCVFRKKLDVPVGILLQVGRLNFSGPLIPTLHQLIDITVQTIDTLDVASS